MDEKWKKPDFCKPPFLLLWWYIKKFISIITHEMSYIWHGWFKMYGILAKWNIYLVYLNQFFFAIFDAFYVYVERSQKFCRFNKKCRFKKLTLWVHILCFPVNYQKYVCILVSKKLKHTVMFLYETQTQLSTLKCMFSYSLPQCVQ